MGQAFENFIFQNLFSRVLNDIKRPSLYYFRDYQDHEVDLIYQKRGRVVIPIEVTYSDMIDQRKLKNLEVFFSSYPQTDFGIIFYLGPVKNFLLKQKKVFALPYFLI